MAKIIYEKKGHIVKCDNCHNMIEYSQSDMKSGYGIQYGCITSLKYILCPNCGEAIYL